MVVTRCWPTCCPKNANGQSVGHVPEIAYDVVDLPSFDFAKLRGGPVLRLALGILKKMVEGDEEAQNSDWPEALLPLTEIENEGQKVELTKELLLFVDKAMAAHNQRLDSAAVSKAIKPIFRDREKTMIKSLFEEQQEIGEARGVIRTLTKRFGSVPKRVSDRVLVIGDSVVLDSLAEYAFDCLSLDEFAKSLP